ncbi:cysteine hydrolase family protein [Bacillus songklensis]|uniref:Cysteine hydrolase family protein n=1 Tax=Bacillus songklensis TaxID=1069116 RepID=A0ABV8B9I0_9BACI
MAQSRPVLVVVDVQKGFEEPVWGIRNNPRAEEQMLRLIQAWRIKEYPIIHVQHASQNPDSPLHPAQPGFPFKDKFGPIEDEYLVRKHVNSCFIGTELDTYLKANGYHTLVIIGLTTNHCVSTTVRMAGNLGYLVYAVHDATACFETVSYDGTHYDADTVHHLALASLHGEFAQVVSTQEVLDVVDALEKNSAIR